MCRRKTKVGTGGVTRYQQGWAEWGRNTPVRAGEGTWLWQLAMQIGTEASEQGEDKTLVRAGP